MTASPETIVCAACEAAGLPTSNVSVSHYSPETFGNFVAVAHTSVGRLEVTYDRGFYIEAESPLEAGLASCLLQLLEAQQVLR
jgi:hypothetical protein